MDPIRDVLEYRPCDSGRLWLMLQSGKTAQEIWNDCPRGDWMLWMLREAQAVKNGVGSSKAWNIGIGRRLMADYEHPVPAWITTAVRKAVPCDGIWWMSDSQPWWHAHITNNKLHTREVADALRAAHPSCPDISIPSQE